MQQKFEEIQLIQSSLKFNFTDGCQSLVNSKVYSLCTYIFYRCVRAPDTVSLFHHRLEKILKLISKDYLSLCIASTGLTVLWF